MPADDPAAPDQFKQGNEAVSDVTNKKDGAGGAKPPATSLEKTFNDAIQSDISDDDLIGQLSEELEEMALDLRAGAPLAHLASQKASPDGMQLSREIVQMADDGVEKDLKSGLPKPYVSVPEKRRAFESPDIGLLAGANIADNEFEIDEHTGVQKSIDISDEEFEMYAKPQPKQNLDGGSRLNSLLSKAFVPRPGLAHPEQELLDEAPNTPPVDQVRSTKNNIPATRELPPPNRFGAAPSTSSVATSTGQSLPLSKPSVGKPALPKSIAGVPPQVSPVQAAAYPPPPASEAMPTRSVTSPQGFGQSSPGGGMPTRSVTSPPATGHLGQAAPEEGMPTRSVTSPQGFAQSGQSHPQVPSAMPARSATAPPGFSQPGQSQPPPAQSQQSQSASSMPTRSATTPPHFVQSAQQQSPPQMPPNGGLTSPTSSAPGVMPGRVSNNQQAGGPPGQFPTQAPGMMPVQGAAAMAPRGMAPRESQTMPAQAPRGMAPRESQTMPAQAPPSMAPQTSGAAPQNPMVGSMPPQTAGPQWPTNPQAARLPGLMQPAPVPGGQMPPPPTGAMAPQSISGVQQFGQQAPPGQFPPPGPLPPSASGAVPAQQQSPGAPQQFGQPGQFPPSAGALPSQGQSSPPPLGQPGQFPPSSAPGSLDQSFPAGFNYGSQYEFGLVPDQFSSPGASQSDFAEEQLRLQKEDDAQFQTERLDVTPAQLLQLKVNAQAKNGAPPQEGAGQTGDDDLIALPTFASSRYKEIAPHTIPPGTQQQAHTGLSAVTGSRQRSMHEETALVLPSSAPPPEADLTVSDQFAKSVPGLTPVSEPGKQILTPPSNRRARDKVSQTQNEQLESAEKMLPTHVPKPPPVQEPERQERVQAPEAPKRDLGRASRVSKLVVNSGRSIRYNPGGPPFELLRKNWRIAVMIAIAVPMLLSIGSLLTIGSKSFSTLGMSAAQKAGKDAYKEKMYPEAVRYFDEAIKADRNNAELFQDRGRSHLALQEYSRAIDDYSRALMIQPNLNSARLDRAAANFYLGRFDQAIDDYDQLIKSHPDDAVAYFGRGLAELKTGQFAESLQDYKKVAQINPDTAQVYENIGNVQLELHHPGEAIKSYTEAIRRDPKSANAIYMRGIAYQGSRDLKKAIEDISAAIALQPGRFEFFNDRGYDLMKLGHYKEAIQDFAYALQLSPQFSMARQNRTMACDRFSRQLQEELHANSNDTTALANLSFCYLNSEDYANAIQCANSALAIDPKNIDALMCRTGAEYKQKRYKVALTDANTTVAANPDNPEIYLLRARIYVQSNELGYALGDYSKCIASKDRIGLLALRERALTHMLSKDSTSAAQDAREFMHINGWQNSLSGPTALIAWLAMRELQDIDGATAILTEAQAHLKPHQWPYPIFKYLKRGMTLEQLRVLAKNDAQMTDVRLWSAFNLFLNGSKAESEDAFAWVENTGYRDNDDYLLAVHH